jgi:hypothetical protein
VSWGSRRCLNFPFAEKARIFRLAFKQLIGFVWAGFRIWRSCVAGAMRLIKRRPKSLLAAQTGRCVMLPAMRVGRRPASATGADGGSRLERLRLERHRPGHCRWGRGPGRLVVSAQPSSRGSCVDRLSWVFVRVTVLSCSRAKAARMRARRDEGLRIGVDDEAPDRLLMHYVATRHARCWRR